MKKSKARKGEEDKRELCQRISKFHSYLREMKTKYAPKSVEDSDWSPLFKLAVDDFETVDYYYELFILESTEEEQKKIYEELKKECKLRLNGMPVPLLRNGYSIFNGTKYR